MKTDVQGRGNMNKTIGGRRDDFKGFIKPSIAVLVFALMMVWATVGAQEKPTIIRFGATGNAFGKPFANGLVEVVHSQKLLEQEFEKDGIPVEWSFYVGTGPAVNEALAADKIDFASYGDICGVIGKANGIHITALASSGRGSNIYIAVPGADKTTKTLEDLKGKRVGFLKGTYLHLEFEKLLVLHHLTDNDFQVFNLGSGEGTAALLAGRIDAYVGSSYFLYLEKHDQSLRVIYSSKTDSEDIKGGGLIVARDEFIKKYPDITKRVLKAYLKAAYWASQSKNRESFLKLSVLGGLPYEAVKADYEETSVRWRNDPLLDTYFYNYYTSTVDFSLQHGLIRQGFDVKQWADQSYIDSAVKELGWEHYWDPK
jgi:sulfonate transport system substrate-binding protein